MHKPTLAAVLTLAALLAGCQKNNSNPLQVVDEGAGTPATGVAADNVTLAAAHDSRIL